MNIFRTALTVIVILTLSVTAFAYSGIFNVAATEQHAPVFNWLLKTIRSKSIDARVGNIDVPDLGGEDMRLAGINDFDSMCSECHTAPGRQPSPIALGLNPPAPDLGEEALEEPPEVLFWATKNGIRMTGMPAWGATHADDEIWPVIAFLLVLPELDGPAYENMLHAADGFGHHAH